MTRYDHNTEEEYQAMHAVESDLLARVPSLLRDVDELTEAEVQWQVDGDSSDEEGSKWGL